MHTDTSTVARCTLNRFSFAFCCAMIYSRRCRCVVSTFGCTCSILRFCVPCLSNKQFSVSFYFGYWSFFCCCFCFWFLLVCQQSLCVRVEQFFRPKNILSKTVHIVVGSLHFFALHYCHSTFNRKFCSLFYALCHFPLEIRCEKRTETKTLFVILSIKQQQKKFEGIETHTLYYHNSFQFGYRLRQVWIATARLMVLWFSGSFQTLHFHSLPRRRLLYLLIFFCTTPKNSARFVSLHNTPLQLVFFSSALNHSYSLCFR